MIPPVDANGVNQMEERAPMTAGDGEELLPGQPATLSVDLSPTDTHISESRGPTPTEESMGTVSEPDAVAQQNVQDGWDGWQDGDLCAVCQAPCSDTPLKCGHALHPQCLAEWTLSNAEQRGNCPTCRQPLASRPRSPAEIDAGTTPRVPSPSEDGSADVADTPQAEIEGAVTRPAIDPRRVLRYAFRFAVLAALILISMLAIFTCTLSDDTCCNVECSGSRAARYRYSNGTCVCADAVSGSLQAAPGCDRWQYPGQRLMRAADSDARCAAAALSNRLVAPPGALLRGKRYLFIPTIGATCASVGLQSLNETFECESVLRAANNDYARDSGLGRKALTQVRRGLAENSFRYLYHVEGESIFSNEDAALRPRRTGWYRKRTPYYSETDCGAATFIEVNHAGRMFQLASHEGDVRANTDNPRYAPPIEWMGFDGPHPINRGVGLPVDISSGWEFIPPIVDVNQAEEDPYARALEAAALQNEAFAQGYVAAIFCAAPDELLDAPVGGICAQEPLSILDFCWWFLFCPVLFGSACVLKKLGKNLFFARVILVLCCWLVYLWITAAQCSQGKTTMINSEIGLMTILLVCAMCVCMCRMPCCNNERRSTRPVNMGH